jgi:protein involved in polysaccharide export with SLBB domain
MPSPGRTFHVAGLAGRAFAILALALYFINVHAHAQDGEPFRIMPETRLKVTVVEWLAAQGEYKEWTALGGEFTVAANGIIDMPLVGAVRAGGETAAAIGADIATRIQKHTGLAKPPSVSIQISAYPPVFVSGSVEKPGAIDYRPGLRVLQAVALAGGRERRTNRDNNNAEFDQIRYVGELRQIDIQTVAQQARRARLEAELQDARKIAFPPEIAKPLDNPALARIAVAEEVLFVNRRDAFNRQLSTLDELKQLLEREIAVLNEKMGAQDRQIEIAIKELNDVSRLVSAGTVARPRETSLERVVAELESNKLDLIVASMRAKQKISETAHDASQLVGQRKSEVSGDLQKVESDLEELRLRRDTTIQLLAASGAVLSRTGNRDEASVPGLTFAISHAGTAASAAPAGENDILQPGDLLIVGSDPRPRGLDGPTASVEWTGAIATAVELANGKSDGRP